MNDVSQGKESQTNGGRSLSCYRQGSREARDCSGKLIPDDGDTIAKSHGNTSYHIRSSRKAALVMEGRKHDNQYDVETSGSQWTSQVAPCRGTDDG